MHVRYGGVESTGILTRFAFMLFIYISIATVALRRFDCDQMLSVKINSILT